MLIASTGGAQAPSKEDAVDLCTRLDAAINAGDSAAWLAQFDPVHDSLFTPLRRSIVTALAGRHRLQQKTTLRRYRTDQEIGIALIDSEIHRCNSVAVMRSTQYLVLARTSAGVRARILLDVHEPMRQAMRGDSPDRAAPNRETFTCPPCNYTLACPAGWLLVPARTDRAGCMESLTFISLRQDSVLEFSAHVELPPIGARDALLGILQHLQTAGGRQQPTTEAWLPPAYQNTAPTPKHLQGAMARMVMRGTGTEPAREVRVHLATYGGLRYLLRLSGTTAGLAQDKERIDQLLGSFRLIDATADPCRLAGRALEIYTGDGGLKAGRYTNRKHRIEVSGPLGWKPTLKAGGYLFMLCFTCPQGENRVTLRALAPMHGLQQWCRASAASLLQETMTNAGWTAKAVGQWRAPTCHLSGFCWRDYEARPVKTGEGTLHHLRLAFQDDILVLFEASTDADHVPLIRSCMDSLRRLPR